MGSRGGGAPTWSGRAAAESPQASLIFSRLSCVTVVRCSTLESMPTGTRGEPPDNSCRVVYSGTYLGTTWAVVHWLQLVLTGPPLPVDQDDLNTGLAIDFRENLFEPFCQTACHFTTTATTIYLPDEAKQRRVRVADAIGTQSGDGLPAQVSLLIDWSTLDGRRGGKPRSYMPGASADLVTESYSVKASELAGLNGHVADYIASVNGELHGNITGCEFVEMSFVTGNAYRAGGVIFPISGGYVRPVLATQRRRVDRQA